MEKDRDSTATLSTGPPTLLQYTLRAGERGNQYVAVAAPLSGKLFRALRLQLRADRPMRISLQLRRPDGRRWRDSIYVDDSARDLVVPLARLASVDGRSGAAVATEMNSLLLVVDLVNAVPGASGKLTIERVALLP